MEALISVWDSWCIVSIRIFPWCQWLMLIEYIKTVRCYENLEPTLDAKFSQLWPHYQLSEALLAPSLPWGQGPVWVLPWQSGQHTQASQASDHRDLSGRVGGSGCLAISTNHAISHNSERNVLE